MLVGCSGGLSPSVEVADNVIPFHWYFHDRGMLSDKGFLTSLEIASNGPDASERNYALGILASISGVKKTRGLDFTEVEGLDRIDSCLEKQHLFNRPLSLFSRGSLFSGVRL